MVKLLYKCALQVPESKIKKLKENLQEEATIDSDFNYQESFMDGMIKLQEKYFDYRPIVLDFVDVYTFYPKDTNHVFVNMENGDSYWIKMDFEIFCSLYQMSTGRFIKDYSNINIEIINKEEKENNGIH